MIISLSTIQWTFVRVNARSISMTSRYPLQNTNSKIHRVYLQFNVSVWLLWIRLDEKPNGICAEHSFIKQCNGEAGVQIQHCGYYMGRTQSKGWLELKLFSLVSRLAFRKQWILPNQTYTSIVIRVARVGPSVTNSTMWLDKLTPK